MMKYCGLARVKDGKVDWDWWESADYHTDCFAEKTFEEYCKKHDGDYYIYVEVDDEEL
jgi:hypothetical protein